MGVVDRQPLGTDCEGRGGPGRAGAGRDVAGVGVYSEH